jgi:hypothetical protein
MVQVGGSHDGLSGFRSRQFGHYFVKGQPLGTGISLAWVSLVAFPALPATGSINREKVLMFIRNSVTADENFFEIHKESLYSHTMDACLFVKFA